MLINGNALHIPLADKSVHCCITSPPYWNLRDYGLGETGIGLESTLEEYIVNIIQVFREVWRVLRDDGTVWLNLGDSMRAKNLVGIPWRIAFALQADGWILRSDIIWEKTNPIPEPTTDRPTKAHEYVFLLTKAKQYFYDGDAIREPVLESSRKRAEYPEIKKSRLKRGKDRDDSGLIMMAGFTRVYNNPAGRNRRSVWRVSSGSYHNPHFAVFPPKLVEPMIKAGCPVNGIVLDPFVGSGTTILASRALGRRAIGIDLSAKYLQQARQRLGLDKLEQWGRGIQDDQEYDDLPIFNS